MEHGNSKEKPMNKVMIDAETLEQQCITSIHNIHSVAIMQICFGRGVGDVTTNQRLINLQVFVKILTKISDFTIIA